MQGRSPPTFLLTPFPPDPYRLGHTGWKYRLELSCADNLFHRRRDARTFKQPGSGMRLLLFIATFTPRPHTRHSPSLPLLGHVPCMGSNGILRRLECGLHFACRSEERHQAGRTQDDTSRFESRHYCLK